MIDETVKMISICGFEGIFARVAQWWSIALPRRGSRVRIPSRAFKDTKKRHPMDVFFLYVQALPGSNGSNVCVPLRLSQQFQMLVKHRIAWYDKICSEMLVDGINPILLMTRRKVGSLLTS